MSREHFKTSARILSMLGDRLIENSSVALTELIKNSYDADASKVIIDFVNFDWSSKEKANNNKSKIVIIDDGNGMTRDNLRDSFLNIASSIKLKSNEERTSPNGRVYLGSHGIGRFSLLKLGRIIQIYTKDVNEKKNNLLRWNFSEYNTDFTDSDNSYLALGDISVDLEETSSELFDKYNILDHGTIITIEELNERWNSEIVKSFAKEVTTFSPIDLKEDDNVSINSSFSIEIRNNNMAFILKEGHENIDINKYDLNRLKSLIDTHASFKLENGYFNEEKKTITFNLTIGPNGKKNSKIITLKDVSNWETFRSNKELINNNKCGDFRFETYIFNFENKSFLDIERLTKEEKELLKKYNVYLYRDGARVIPYGNEGIDWLEIERLRAETRAGDYFSQGQLVGQIFITKNGNPALQDKTSREGLIINGKEFDKLKIVYRLLLEYIKKNYYDSYKNKEKTRLKAEEERKDLVSKQIKQIMLDNKDNKALIDSLKNIQKDYDTIRINYKQRVDIVEQLAGAGMSIEITTHDLYSTLTKMGSKLTTIERLLNRQMTSGDLDSIKILNEDCIYLNKIGIDQLENIQKLLVSSKQRAKKIDVNKKIIEIVSLYRERLIDKKIDVAFVNEDKTIYAETIDAVIYQTICNLIDNAIYWLDNDDCIDRRIVFTFDAQNKKIIVSDNGPGVEKKDEPYIFDAFFSGKGVKGRGLGLYISKRLLQKFDFDIRLAKKNENILEGANFVIDFLIGE